MKKIKATDIGLGFIVISYSLLLWGFLSSCNNGTKKSPNLPEMIAKSYYDSEVARCNRNDSNYETTYHRLYAIDSELVVINNKWQDSLKTLRKRIFIAEFRLARVDYHLSLVKKNPSKFKPFFQGWTDRDIHYELYLDSNAAFRNYVEGLAAIEIDKELK